MDWITNHLFISFVLMVIVGVSLVFIIFRVLPTIYPHETSNQVAGVMASLVIVVLFSVVLGNGLNNWLALKRDKINRLSNLRDQHYGQLRPVLQKEALNLKQIVTLITKEGYITGVGMYYTGSNPPPQLWPDPISQDLHKHFPEYEKLKQNLRSQMETQDQEFRAAINVVEVQINSPDLSPYWKEVAAMSFIEQCLGHGDGVLLNIYESGFNFSYWGGGGGNSGPREHPPRPAPDKIATFQAFQSLRLAPSLKLQCDSLKSRANAIQHMAEDLAQRALLLSQGTILKGTCEFIKTDDLSD